VGGITVEGDRFASKRDNAGQGNSIDDRKKPCHTRAQRDVFGSQEFLDPSPSLIVGCSGSCGSCQIAVEVLTVWMCHAAGLCPANERRELFASPSVTGHVIIENTLGDGAGI